jgi:hypothetical protein
VCRATGVQAEMCAIACCAASSRGDDGQDPCGSVPSGGFKCRMSAAARFPVASCKAPAARRIIQRRWDRRREGSLWRVHGGAGGGLAYISGGEVRTRRWGEELGGCGCGMQRRGGIGRESRGPGWGSGISGAAGRGSVVHSFKHGIAVRRQINRSYVPDRLDQPLWGFY